MTKRQLQLLIEALQQRICFIETGTVTYRATDCNKYTEAKPRGLDRYQLELVLELSNLVDRFEREFNA